MPSLALKCFFANQPDIKRLTVVYHLLFICQQTHGNRHLCSNSEVTGILTSTLLFSSPHTMNFFFLSLLSLLSLQYLLCYQTSETMTVTQYMATDQLRRPYMPAASFFSDDLYLFLSLSHIHHEKFVLLLFFLQVKEMLAFHFSVFFFLQMFFFLFILFSSSCPLFRKQCVRRVISFLPLLEVTHPPFTCSIYCGLLYGSN